MIRSMTGYGGAKGTVQGLELSIELKSVNNRFLDTSVRLPRTYLFAEEAVKAAVQRHISRGKVDVFVTVESAGTQDVVVKVNEPLLRGSLAALQQVPRDLYEAADIDGATGIRQFFTVTIPLLSPTIFFVLQTRIIGALQVFDLPFMVMYNSSQALPSVQSAV